MEGDEPRSGSVGPDERSWEKAGRKLPARLRTRIDQRNGAELCGDRTAASCRDPVGAGRGPHLHFICRARLQGVPTGPNLRSATLLGRPVQPMAEEQVELQRRMAGVED